jgi:hypothetical protein
MNAELLATYGVDAHKAHLADLDKIAAAASARVAAISARIESVNAARKAGQEPHGPRLKTLARKYSEAAAASFDVEVACADAEREVKRLRGLARERGLLKETEEGGGEQGAGAAARGGRGSGAAGALGDGAPLTAAGLIAAMRAGGASGSSSGGGGSASAARP